MFNGTNLTLNSDLALVSTQVKTLLHIVGQKARESSDTGMSTCDGVRHIPGHWKISKSLDLLLLIGGRSACADLEGDRGSGHPPPPRKPQKYRFFSNTHPEPLKIVKLPSQLSILGHNRHGSKTPFKWRFAGGRKMAR